jgi:hypothetical protein
VSSYGRPVAYDVLAESRRLIADGLPGGPVRLSRRRRFAPVAVDVDGAVAGTRFVRRGAGCFWDETHLLVRDDDDWRVLGGGGAGSGEPWSTDAFERAREELPHGHVRVTNGPSVWQGPRWLRAAHLLVGHGVAVVLVDDRRMLTVPGHGRLLVVWASASPPRVSARDAAGREVASVALPEQAAALPDVYTDDPATG